MNRTVGVLLVILVVCDAVAAQQEIRPSTQSSQATEKEQATPARPTFIFKPTFRLQIELAQSQARDVQLQQTIVIGPPQFVIKDQALFLDVLGNGVLIPVPGGGASGCFGWDSEKKFYELRQTFQGLPARGQSTTATQK
ncbi:MAG TPA: hypothetical protein VKF81_11195 [Blastocatellia bacterium]|nr:hypothetical protein [Blastocatellia bacterium]